MQWETAGVFGVTKMKFDIPVLKFPHLQNGTNINEIT